MADEHRRLEENRCTKIRQRSCFSLCPRKRFASASRAREERVGGWKIERGEGNTNALTRKLRHNGYLPLHLARCSVLSIGCTGIGASPPVLDEFLSTRGWGEGGWLAIHRWKMRFSTNNHRDWYTPTSSGATSWFPGYSPWDSSCAYSSLSATYQKGNEPPRRWKLSSVPATRKIHESLVSTRSLEEFRAYFLWLVDGQMEVICSLFFV